MSDLDLAYAPALDQAARLRRREVSSTELTELYLRRIDALNPELNAFLTVSADHALDAAAAADKRLAGDEETRPPFLGVPISIKDLSDTAGIRTTYATAAWSERVPTTDAWIVQRIRAGGFVILGKTNTPEFGKSVLSESPAYPPGRNPWDTSRTPGGSSGGAAAAVAAGLGSVAHGSDSGGSIRIPAALCGVVGLKPSRGRVSFSPRAPRLYTTDGPLTWTVTDAAALLDVMAGHAAGDPWWAPPPPRPFAAEVGEDPGRLRVALTVAPFIEGAEPAPANVAAARDAAELLVSLGHEVVEATPPWDPDVAEQAVVVFGVEGAEEATDPDYPPLETLDIPQRTLVEIGRTVSGVDYVRTQRSLHDLGRRVHEFFAGDGAAGFDLVLTPTVPGPALPVGAFAADGASDFEVMLRSRQLAAYTPFANLTGLPAITLPLSVDEVGLPVGAHLVGGPAQDAAVIRVAAQVEGARPWAHRRPPLATKA